MSPLDRTREFQRAFEKAEEAWLRWKRSPLGDVTYELQGEVLMQAFVEAARTYLNCARHHTAVRRRDPALYTHTAADILEGRGGDEDVLDIPDFLRRNAQ
jgi:hypothetical protein